MKTEPHKQHYVEILPAALLSQRHSWQAITRLTSANTYLLVANPNNETQIQFMRQLTRLFRQKGRPAIFWIATES